MSKRIPVTEEDKKKSYYPFYLREMAQPNADTLEFMKDAEIKPADALMPENRNDLFKPGYLTTERGYCILENGTAYVSNHTVMHGVTVEMIDWYFCWHGLDDLRYRIWDSEDHYYARTQDLAHALDRNLSMKERFWGTKQYIKESVGPGEEELLVTFFKPGDVGFEQDKIGTELCGTIICGHGQSAVESQGMPPAIMTHFVREIEAGIELRSRFWIGYKYVDGNPAKVLPDNVKIPIQAPKALYEHNVKEFTNLAAILPELYAQEKDNW